MNETRKTHTLFHIAEGAPIAVVTSKAVGKVERREPFAPEQRVVELYSSEDGTLRYRLWPEQITRFEYVTVGEIPSGAIVL